MPICCAFIVNEEKEVLLVKPAANKKKKWMLPGGKIKIYENESPLKCVIREVFEETALDITGCKAVIQKMHVYKRCVMVYIIQDFKKVDIVPPNAKEIKEAKWISVSAIEQEKKVSDIFRVMFPKIKHLIR